MTAALQGRLFTRARFENRRRRKLFRCAGLCYEAVGHGLRSLWLALNRRHRRAPKGRRGFCRHGLATSHKDAIHRRSQELSYGSSSMGFKMLPSVPRKKKDGKVRALGSMAAGGRRQCPMPPAKEHFAGEIYYEMRCSPKAFLGL